MEFYDQAFTNQLAPLVKCVLGTGPEVDGLKTYLDYAQPSHFIWDNAIIKNRLSAVKFRIEYADSEAELDMDIRSHKSQAADTHSPLSPFNSSSDLFPSGVLSSKWFRKYTSDVPFAAVCVYHLSPDANDDVSLAQTLLTTRKKYLGYNVRFAAIIVSSLADSTVLNDRLTQLRQISGLPNLSGLFHLSLSADELNTECEMLVSNLINALKTTATDFYSGIESRVKHRFKKYYTMPRSEVKTSIELSPKILETRNLIKQGVLLQLMHPHNVESSIAILENSHENLLDLISSNAAHFFSKSRSPHDYKVYVQWRTLLDVVAIHLVRCYFSIEEPLSALKKHRSHVQALAQILNAHAQQGVKIWVATQYHWLANLMVLIPKSILQEVNDVASSKGKKAIGITGYVGGLITADGDIIETNASFLFEKAARILAGQDDLSSNSEPLNLSFTEISDVVNYKIRLYEQAREFTSHTENPIQDSLELRLLVEIAEGYMALRNFEKATEYFELAHTQSLAPSWHRIHESVTKKLILAALEAGNSVYALKYLASLCATGTTESIKLHALDIQDAQSIRLESSPSFFRVDVSMFNQSLREEVRVHDEVTTQIRLESLFDPVLLEKAISGSEVNIRLDSIDVTYDNNETIRINSTGKQQTQIQVERTKNNKAAFNLSNFRDRSIVLHMKHTVSQTGWLSVKEIFLDLTIKVKHQAKEISLNKLEKIFLEQGKIKQTFDMYTANELGDMVKTPRFLRGRAANQLLVKAYKPDLRIETDLQSKSIIVGEKLETAVKLLFPQQILENIKCKSVRIQTETIVYDDMIETKALHAQVNWDLMKDDEPMEILQELISKTTERQHSLHLRIMKPPSYIISNDSDLKVVVYFKLIVISDSAEVSEFDISQLDMKILSNPFSQILTVEPTKHESEQPSIPSPFVIRSKSEESSMPVLSRSWLLEYEILDSHDLLKSENIEVLSVDLNMRSMNSDVEFYWSSQLSTNGSSHKREFVTKGTYRPTTMNTTMVASAEYTYKRKGSRSELKYQSEDEELSLSLQDPRVLLSVEKANKAAKFSFAIENPTSRILTYSTALTADKAASKGVTWNFEDVRNEYPLQHTIIPILPFSQHVIQFFATYDCEDNDDGVIELPELAVFDVHYKVNLPVTSLQRDVKVANSGSYIKY